MSQKVPQSSMKYHSEVWLSDHRLCLKHQTNSTCSLRLFQVSWLSEKTCEAQCRQETHYRSLSLKSQWWGSLTCPKVKQLVSLRKSTPLKMALSCSSQDYPSMSCEVRHSPALPNLLKRETISYQTNLSQKTQTTRVISDVNSMVAIVSHSQT